MEGLGHRLRVRARELGWSDAEVARRAGIAQTRYANYVSDRHEPDLATFARICSVLGASASDLLGQTLGEKDEAGRLRAHVASAMEALDVNSLATLVAVTEGLIARMIQAAIISPKPRSVPRSRTARPDKQ